MCRRIQDPSFWYIGSTSKIGEAGAPYVAGRTKTKDLSEVAQGATRSQSEGYGRELLRICRTHQKQKGGVKPGEEKVLKTELDRRGYRQPGVTGKGVLG